MTEHFSCRLLLKTARHVIRAAGTRKPWKPGLRVLPIGGIIPYKALKGTIRPLRAL